MKTRIIFFLTCLTTIAALAGNFKYDCTLDVYHYINGPAFSKTTFESNGITSSTTAEVTLEGYTLSISKRSDVSGNSSESIEMVLTSSYRERVGAIAPMGTPYVLAGLGPVDSPANMVQAICTLSQ